MSRQGGKEIPCLLWINMSETGKQSSGCRPIKCVCMQPPWQWWQRGREWWWSKSGMSVNPFLTQHFPVTCVIVNGAQPPTPTPPSVSTTKAPCSISCCLFFVPLTPRRCQHWVYSFKWAFAHSLHHNCISAGWGCLATGQQKRSLKKTSSSIKHKPVLFFSRDVREGFMFQTQHTSLIRSWKWKKGKVGCDWEGGREERCEWRYRACSPFALNCMWVAACLLPFRSRASLFCRGR